MAKAGKLGKLLKKMQSIGRTSSHRSNDQHASLRRSSSVASASISNNFNEDDTSVYEPSKNLIPVYVGKTRRCYMVGSDVVEHPLFRELVDRTAANYGNCEEISVGCEVVLFEHLLWMLENADTQPESLDELVDFYAC